MPPVSGAHEDSASEGKECVNHTEKMDMGKRFRNERLKGGKTRHVEEIKGLCNTENAASRGVLYTETQNKSVARRQEKKARKGTEGKPYTGRVENKGGIDDLERFRR